MKIRNGFVSNSSSSSFILGYKGEFHKVVPKALTTLLEKLSPQATHIDVLIRETGLAPYIVNTILMELEIAGKIERFAGQYVALIYNNEWVI